jgi:hypothetical protein
MLCGWRIQHDQKIRVADEGYRSVIPYKRSLVSGQAAGEHQASQAIT